MMVMMILSISINQSINQSIIASMFLFMEQTLSPQGSGKLYNTKAGYQKGKHPSCVVL